MILLASPERDWPFDLMADLSDFSKDAKAITSWMQGWFDSALGPADQLKSAMGYSALSGGKRLRGGLVLACRRLAQAQSGRSEGDGLALAAAVEMLHAYSLIHDDLPAMDDADLRRGQPAAHLAYDEATAILAGDALQTAAFQLLADPGHHPDAGVRAGMVLALAEASGLGGMAGGQMLDLQAEAGGFDLSAMQEMQDLKTGALIRAACQIGGLSAYADDRLLAQLDSYACHLGLAFQIADDLLDIQGDAAKTGKPGGQDQARGKATFVDFLGVEGATAEAARLAGAARETLLDYGETAAALVALADFVTHRDH